MLRLPWGNRDGRPQLAVVGSTGLLSRRMVARDVAHAPRYRAILRLAIREMAEHWEVQELTFTFYRYAAWRFVTRVPTPDEAQALIDRLQYESVLYPTVRP